MNNIPYFNNRMDGVEIAESLLYKDFEKTCGNISDRFSRLSNYIHKTATFRESGIDACLVNSEIYGLDSCKDTIYSQIDSKDTNQKHLMNSNSVDLNLHDRFILVNKRSTVSLSTASIDKPILANENSAVDHFLRSNSHFRPISPDIFHKSNILKDSKQLSENISLEFDSDMDKISNTEVNNRICSSSYSGSNESNIKLENKKTCSVFKLYSQSNFPNRNAFADTNDSINYKDQMSTVYAQNLMNKIKLEESVPLRTDTLCDSRCFMHATKTSQILTKPLNWDPLLENTSDESDKQEIEKTSNIAALKLMSSQSETESLKTVLATTSYAVPTITIPRGSYIFIPLTTHNYYLNDSSKQNCKTIDLSVMPIISNSTNQLNKLIIGCYPIMNPLPDQKPTNVPLSQLMTTRPSTSDNGEPSSVSVENKNSNSFRLQNHSSMLTSMKTISKRLESGEFNHYLENLNESHKMLIKEKNKISTDKNFLKDEKPKTIFNGNNNYEKTLSKVECELNSIINSLFEINLLISKIESIRGISFVEPFYKMIQKSAELIQNIQWKNSEDSYSRNSDANKLTETETENHIMNLKQLYNDLEKFRNFLWAAYTNLNFDQQRQLSVSLTRLKSWTENKANLKNIFKSKESNIKYQLPTCTADSFISCQSFIPNSTKPTVKIENNTHSLSKHPFTIPVSRYSQVPNRMTTILHGYSNPPPPINNAQFSYFQTPLSNFSHPQLLNTNKFSLGSSCRLSYGPQQQIYTATPILASTQTSISPRNFLITQSSLVTPIIYQNNPRQIQLNNGSLNYMVYNSNPPIL